MDGEAIVSVSAAVVALTQLAKWARLPDKLAPVVVVVFALIGVAFWGWTQGGVSREVAFGYFAGWVAVMTSAAGVWGFTRASSESLTKVKKEQ